MSNKIYQIVTDRMLEELEKGVAPWDKPWRQDGSLPMNLITKKPYRGMNIYLLPYDYSSPFFVTFNQCKTLGGSIKKGEKSHVVIFWKFFKTDCRLTGIEKSVPMLRYYRVFNTDQCDGINPAKIPTFEKGDDIEPIYEAEQIISNMPNRPEIVHGEARAYYQPCTDKVNMPKKDLWDNPEEYYSVLFHEIVHSTGHKSRCNRKIENNAGYGSETYSKEELIAEMGSAFLCGITGIETETTFKRSASYINGWMQALKKDVKLIVTAAGKAQKAADYIQGIENTYTENGESEKPREVIKEPPVIEEPIKVIEEELQTVLF